MNAVSRGGDRLTLSVLQVGDAAPFLTVRSSTAGTDVTLEPAVTRALIAALTKTLETRGAEMNSGPYSESNSGFHDPREMDDDDLREAVRAARLDRFDGTQAMQDEVAAWLEVAETELEARAHFAQRIQSAQLGAASNDSPCSTSKDHLTQWRNHTPRATPGE